MSLLMKWAELACFSQNPVLTGSLSVLVHIPPVRMVCRVQSCFFTEGIPVEGISFCVGRAAVNSSVNFRELTPNSPLNLTL